MEMGEEFDTFFKDNNLDGIVFPGGTVPALLHSTAKELFPAMSLTFVFNALHVPAGTVPITTVREDETVYRSSVHDAWAKEARKVVKNSQGLPVGVQIVCPTWRDEACLRIMSDLEQQANFVGNNDMPTRFSAF